MIIYLLSISGGIKALMVMLALAGVWGGIWCCGPEAGLDSSKPAWGWGLRLFGFGILFMVLAALTPDMDQIKAARTFLECRVGCAP